MIEELKDIAFRIHIEPLKTVEHAAKVDTVIKVLSDIVKSYNNYLEIEFLKNDEYKKAFDSNKNVLETIKEQLNLLVVDLNFSSFEAALAPDLTELQSPIFTNEVLKWKKDTFENYKEDVILADYNNISFLQKVVNKYSEAERIKIFQPFFSSVGDGKDYKLNIKNQEHKIIKSLAQPEKAKINLYVPKLISNQAEAIYGTAQVFVKIRKGEDRPKLTKKNVKEILYYEELEHETYPYKPDILKYNEKIFLLNKKLDCQVEYEDDSYIIKNEELDIVVWGSSREEVEEAFSFSFYALYLNYFLEENENLSDEARELKSKLAAIIKNIVDEAKKD
jgi:hypothetical protein